MPLSSEIISQFVKATKDDKKNSTESTVYGTTVEYNGRVYVKLDGSDLLTPVTTTTDVKSDERVTVMIKDHTATITGNISSPAARTDTVKELGTQISEVGILVADKVSTEELEAESARITEIVADNVLIREQLTAAEASIDELEANNVTINGKLTAQSAEITRLETEKLSANAADIKFATIESLEAIEGEFHTLESTYADFKELTTTNLDAVNASIVNLDAKKLSAEQADLLYANIDFSNIGEAAVKKLFSESGIINNLVMSDGVVTGELVGVTIKGDLIDGGTVIADKLVVQGEDGIYYKLNVEAGATTSEEVTEEELQNGLHGTTIIAKTITAEKIAVDDLVAFGATIGGFNITTKSLYSGVKASADNTTRGVYLDTEGQLSVGDSNNFLRYYQDENGDYRLEISAASLMFSSSGKNIESYIDDTQNVASNAMTNVTAVESSVQQLADSISTLVTDVNGASLMTQTENGWTFSIGEIENALSDATSNIDSLTGDLNETTSAVENLKQAVDNLGVLANYIKITLDGDQPCIELGESENNFKVRITNTEIHFADGTVIPTRITRQMMIIERAMVRNELQFGDDKDTSIEGVWIWKRRSNGNLGLLWKEVNS